MEDLFQSIQHYLHNKLELSSIQKLAREDPEKYAEDLESFKQKILDEKRQREEEKEKRLKELEMMGKLRDSGYKELLLQDLLNLSKKLDQLILSKFHKNIDESDEKENLSTNKKTDPLKQQKSVHGSGVENLVARSLKNASSNSTTHFAEQTSDENTRPYFLKQLSQEELDEVPKYLAGRLNLNKINKAIESLNQIIKYRYDLLKMKPNKVPREMKPLYNDLLEIDRQRLPNKFSHLRGQDVTLFTDSDLKGAKSTFKTDPAAKSTLLVLRTCHKIKEFRQAKSTKYVVLSP